MNKSFDLRHEDFNWSIFDLEQFLLEHSDLGYSCFLYEDPCFQCFLIETVKYSRTCLVITSLPIWAQQDSTHVMLAIWQCNRTVKETVNTSCLYKRAQKALVLHSAETDFHCQKKQGRTFHMVTASNSSGEPVVQYFSGQTGEQLDACGSFVRFK